MSESRSRSTGAPWWARWTMIAVALMVVTHPGILFSVGSSTAKAWSEQTEAAARPKSSESAAADVPAVDSGNTAALVSGLLPCQGDPATATTSTTGCDVWILADGSWLLTTQGTLRLQAGATGGSSKLIGNAPTASTSSHDGGLFTWVRFAIVVGLLALVFIVRRMVTIARRESDDRMGVGSGRNRTADGLLTAYPNAAAAGGDD